MNSHLDQLNFDEVLFSPLATTRFPFPTRTNAVTDEYDVSKDVLGEGISGGILKCQHRQTKQNCALKV